MPKKAIISGAGLVGSLLAILLKKNGQDVTLFEKLPDMRKSELNGGRSINLIITSRGINAVKKLGLLEEVLAITVPVTGRMMHSREGELTYQPYGKDDTECNYSISRAELNMLLMDIAEKEGVEIKFDSPCVSVNSKNKSAIFETNKIEAKHDFDLLFGTDGAASVVRKELIKTLGDKAEESMELIDSDYKELFMPADSSGNYPIEKNALHIWPRTTHMLMALPNLDGSFTMTVYMPKKGPGFTFSSVVKDKEIQTLFDEEFSDVKNLMPNFKKNYLENPQGILGTVKCSPWNIEDSIALVGDAAHAIVPFFGQGMNCGFEDVYLLAALIDKHADDWGTILSKYSKFQKPNADAIADMALENFIEMRDKVGDANFLLKKKVERKIEQAFSEKYRSRYALVTYTLVPYSFAFEIGEIQNKILTELCENITHEDELDLSKAEELVDNLLTPYVKERNISFERYDHNKKLTREPYEWLFN